MPGVVLLVYTLGAAGLAGVTCAYITSCSLCLQRTSLQQHRRIGENFVTLSCRTTDIAKCSKSTGIRQSCSWEKPHHTSQGFAADACVRPAEDGERR